MLKRLLVTILLLTLSACEHTHSWAQRFAFMYSPKEELKQFDFNWQLSGDREVAPLQVFSSGDRVWLQFALEQNIPAIFAVKNEHHIPLSYKRSEPYIVVDGAWQELVFRGAALQARAQYQTVTLAATLDTPLVAETAEAIELNQQTTDVLVTETVLDLGLELQDKSPIAVVNTTESFAFEALPYSVGPDDGTMRQALKRWAQREGWVFLDQHWEIEIDLPIVSSALFSTDFNQAITELMRSTAMGTRPLQVCLYSNKVMRVIPLAQNCDPTTTASYLSQG